MLRYGTIRTRRRLDVCYAAVGPDGDPWATPVFLMHPINLRKECWLDLVRVLSGDRLCVAVDLADHGESGDAEDSTLGGWVSDCLDVIDALELDSVHLVGGSLGGTIALCAASERPAKALSVTAMGSSLGAGPDAAGGAPDEVRMLDESSVDELFAVLAVEALAPGAPDPLVTTVRHLTNRHGAATVRRTLTAAATADARAWAPGVRCQVLVVTGEHDTTCTPEAGRLMAGSVGGRQEVLPNVGHLPMIEDAGAVAKVLLAHLDSAEAKAGFR